MNYNASKVIKSFDIFAVIIDVGLILENSAVYQSQVAEQLVALSSYGLNVGLIAVYDDKEHFKKTVGQRFSKENIQVFLVKDRGFILNLLCIIFYLNKIKNKNKIRTAYVRGLWGPVAIRFSSLFNRMSYIYDVRGTIGDESIASGTGYIKRHIYKWLESWGIRNAKHITAVTQYLADHIKMKCFREDVFVIPSSVNTEMLSISDEDAQQSRTKLGYDISDIVLIYSGGLSHYQQVPAMLNLWRKVLDEEDVHFLLLTNDDPHSKRQVIGSLDDFGSRIQHKSVSRKDVPLILASADIGFMLRDARELNYAASPVKFAEYLAAGLVIVASPGTGDASNLIEEKNIGVLIEPGNYNEGEALIRQLLSNVRKNRSIYRTRSKSLAYKRYDWKAYIGIYQELYSVNLTNSKNINCTF
jgi:glycosyltransferase involved in cell wall biosynthesis